jgi:hypothetical protein
VSCLQGDVQSYLLITKRTGGGGGAVSIVYKELSSKSACILATVRNGWTDVNKYEVTLCILILQWKHCLSVSSRWTILWFCDYLTNISLSRYGSTIVDGCNAVKQPTAGRDCKWLWRWNFVTVGSTGFPMWMSNSRPHSEGSRVNRFNQVMGFVFIQMPPWLFVIFQPWCSCFGHKTLLLRSSPRSA